MPIDWDHLVVISDTKFEIYPHGTPRSQIICCSCLWDTDTPTYRSTCSNQFAPTSANKSLAYIVASAQETVIVNRITKTFRIMFEL